MSLAEWLVIDLFLFWMIDSLIMYRRCFSRPVYTSLKETNNYSWMRRTQLFPQEGVVAYLKCYSNIQLEIIWTGTWEYSNRLPLGYKNYRTTTMFSPCPPPPRTRHRSVTALTKDKKSKSVSMRRSIQHVLCRQPHNPIVWYANIISEAQTGRRMRKTQRNTETFYATASRGLLLDALSVRKNEDFR
jgi:hypothetical protein